MILFLDETGLQSTPYKSMLGALTEILNLHSHSQYTVNLYIKENSVMYVPMKYFYVLNMTQFNMKTYTSSAGDPRSSTLIFTDQTVQVFSPKTKYNFVFGMVFNTTKVIDAGSFSTREKTQLRSNNTGIVIGRTSFKVENVHFQASFSSSSQAFTLFKPVYQQNRNFEMSNLNLNISGSLFETFSPLNMQVINVDIDYFRTVRGFYIASS